MTTAHHPHPHPAGHDHHRQHAPESYPHVRGGPTVLVIGGDVGALIAMMDPDTAGTELHLRSEHQPPIDIHTGVWHRGSGDDEATTAVFAELLEGTYWVLDPDGSARQQVRIRGGELARIDLRN
jgi:hypothetical protein